MRLQPWTFGTASYAIQRDPRRHGESHCRVIEMHAGLSMLELLIVLAIIAVLISLTTPAVMRSRERARNTVCLNNLKNLDLALVQYVQATKELPLKARADTVGGWTVKILPFIGMKSWRDAVPEGQPLADVDASLFEPHGIFRCPEQLIQPKQRVDGIEPGMYLLVTDQEREVFSVSDAPIDLRIPWINSPECTFDQMKGRIGPHHKGFNRSNGFSGGVYFVQSF